MNRSYLRNAAGLLVAVLLAACADATNAPHQEIDMSSDPIANAPATAPVYPSGTGAAASVAVIEGASVQSGDTVVTTFDVNGRKDGVYLLGRHWIYFQAGSICDPLRSTYGEEEWNKSCPTVRSMRIVAKVWADSNGTPKVEFWPHLRFSPDKYVVLHMTYDIAGIAEPKILWFKNDRSTPVDEGEKDQALITKGDQLLVYRRIKHFSGYLLSSGFLREGDGGEGQSVDLGLGYYRSGAIGEIGPQSLGSGHVVATGALGSTPPQ